MAVVVPAVDNAFLQAKTYADTATGAMTGFTAALTGAIHAAPQIGFDWHTPNAPSAPQAPAPLTIEPVDFVLPGSTPTALTDGVPNIVVSEFTLAPPSLSYGSAPTLNYGAAPTVPSIGDVAVPDAPTVAAVALPAFTVMSVPAVPSISTGTPPTLHGVSLPDVPTVVLPDAPEYLSLSVVSFGGIDMHEDYLAKLETIPTLSLVAPTPYSYSRGPEYASALLSGLKATINMRLAGGTGLAPAVEQAIWDRARSRETQLGLANEAEVMRNSEAFGFQLPTGVLAAQLREAQRGYYEKLSGLSRDVAIKQAELEQENLKQTIAQGMELEAKLIDYSTKMEQIAFDAAKTLADNAIAAYNAQVEQYKALLGGYQTYAAAYKTIIDGELAKVEVYKAQLSGEQTKAQMNANLVLQYKTGVEASMVQVEVYKALLSGEQMKVQIDSLLIEQYKATLSAEMNKIEVYKAQLAGEQSKVDMNRSLVEQYKAQIEAGMSQIEVYKAQVGGASMLVQLEQAKISAAGEQVRAYTATVNAETAKVEVFKAQVGAEGLKAEMYKAQTQAYSAQASAQAEKARAEVSRFTAIAQAKAAEWQGYNAAVAAEGERVKAVGISNNALVEGYKAESAATIATAELEIAVWKGSLAQYDAAKTLAFQTNKANNDLLLATRTANLDAAKVGAQVYAQLASSAYGMINASASISGSVSESTSFEGSV